MNAEVESLEEGFAQITAFLMGSLAKEEHLTLTLQSEQSQFTRFNHGKVRQTGTVNDGSLSLVLVSDSREAYAEFPFSSDRQANMRIADQNLQYLRQEIGQVPPNPYVVLPQNLGSSRELYAGEILAPEQAIAEILSPIADLDFTGLYAAGNIVRAHANSAGQQHWFATDSFFVDYSIFTTDQNLVQKAVKGSYAGRDWQAEAYQNQIQRSHSQLDNLQIPAKTIPRGSYRTYFAPAATADLVGMLLGSASEAAIQQKSTALLKLHQDQQQLSPLFTLLENFENGTVPRFNHQGEVAPVCLPIIQAGKLQQTLISSRTALEYGKTANGASRGETLRSPEMLGGELAESDILADLDTGLYLGNLHYLNWSDEPNGRLTGMTRYACFWVENGKIIAPIENLRFDDSIYNFLGENLAALTQAREFIPDVSTYGSRSLGGIWTPGMLVKDFVFTL